MFFAQELMTCVVICVCHWGSREGGRGVAGARCVGERQRGAVMGVSGR